MVGFSGQSQEFQTCLVFLLMEASVGHSSAPYGSLLFCPCMCGHVSEAVCPVHAQISFLQHLMAKGLAQSMDVVFLDMDILVIDSLAEVLHFLCCSEQCIDCSRFTIPVATDKGF